LKLFLETIKRFGFFLVDISLSVKNIVLVNGLVDEDNIFEVEHL